MTQKLSFVGKGFSVKQPFAAAILFAGKDVENRSKRTQYRGPVAIHASAVPRPDWEEQLEQRFRREAGASPQPLKRLIAAGQRRWELPTDYDPHSDGCIVGVGMLVDCVEQSSSPWYEGRDFGWVLAGVVPIEPIPWKGQVGLWNGRFAYRPLPRAT